jgi:hypothetical protein
MKKLIFITFFTSIWVISTAQFSCDMPEQIYDNAKLNDPAICGNTYNYSQDLPNFNERPIITIRVNVHFLLDNNGNGNFKPNGDGYGNSWPTGFSYANDMINDANNALQSNQQMGLPIGNNTPILPININYEIWKNPAIPGDQGIYFHNVSNGDNIYDWDLSGFKANYSVNGNNVLDIWMLTDAGASTNQLGGIAAGFQNNNNHVKLNDAWHSYNNGQWVWGPWNFGKLLNHEIGHLLGLSHTGAGANGCSDISPSLEPTNSWGGAANNVMSYNAQQTAYTPCQLGIIHEYLSNRTPSYVKIDWCENNPIYSTTIETGNSEIWNSSRFLKGDLIIEPQATLTIQCRTSMPNDAKVVVQPGGKLIIDGGQITNSCGGLWRGVELWGNKSTAQYQLTNGYYSQPYIEIKNGGEISYAQDAITTWKTGDYNSSGGIIKCNDAVFKNNLRGIEFIAYQNFNRNFPTFKLPSICNFENTKFIHDNNLPNNTNPKPFVTAWAVDGIKFNNCTFENINLNATSTAKLGKGIVSLDANFTVTNSKFNELEIGVNAQLGSSSWNYTIDKCKFTNCLGGVFNQAVNKAVLTRNEFILGKPRFGSWFTYGISFNAGTAYRIEENKFDKDAAGNVYSIGTLIQGTGGDMNQVYKNQFNKVEIGNLSSGQNRLYNLLSGQNTGLQYFCNSHSLVNTYDIAITGDGKSDGVCNYQGVLSSGSSIVQRSGGNDFSRIGSVSGESDYYNHSPLGLFYFYDNSSLSKYPQSVTSGGKVIRVNNQNPHFCLSKITSSGGGGRPGIGIGGLSGELVTIIQTDFVSHRTTYNQLKTLYSQLLDGGNTENLKQEVNTAWTNETWELRSKLLGKSPYLSEAVLKEANDKEEVLPDAILFEILAANPDCFKDEYFVKYIEEESKRLPDWMLELLKQMTESNISAKNLLESQIAYHKSEMDFDATVLANGILAEGEEGNDIDWNAYRSWIGTYQTPWGDYQLVDNYLQTNELEQASLLLNAIPNLYKLSENERREYDALKGVTSTLFKLNSENRNLFELTPFEKEQLKSISDNGTGTGQVRACNILSFVTGEKICEFTPNIPRGDNMRKINTPANKTSDIPAMEIIAFPVPAKDYVELYYTLPIGVNEALLRIVDIQGKLMEQQAIKGERGQIALNTANWPTGIYTYTVSTNDKTMTSQKLVIEK